MKVLLVSAAIVVVAVTAAVLNFVGVFALSNLDGSRVAADISQRLSEGAVVHVTCPSQIAEKKGGIEDCTATAGHGVTVVRVVQDDSRGHFHYEVGDPTVLIPSPDPSVPPASSPERAFGEACVGFGGSGSQCACLYGQLINHGTPEDVLRAAESYRSGDGLPEDLAYAGDACRRGA